MVDQAMSEPVPEPGSRPKRGLDGGRTPGHERDLDGGKGLDDFSLVGELLPWADGSSGNVVERPDCAGLSGGARPGSIAPRGVEEPARLVATVWPDVVGEEVAANARPVYLQRGRLVVSTSSSAWAQTLQLMGGAIVERLRERLGAGLVEQAVFRHAGWEGRPPASAGPAPIVAVPAGSRDGSEGPHGEAGAGVGGDAGRAYSQGLSREQKEALTAVERLDLPDDLRSKIVRSMRAAFVRGGQDYGR